VHRYIVATTCRRRPLIGRARFLRSAVVLEA
jgi:hypothetical protein